MIRPYIYEVIAADWKKGGTIPHAEMLVLNEMGHKGWECIDVDRDGIGRFTLLTFKREDI